VLHSGVFHSNSFSPPQMSVDEDVEAALLRVDPPHQRLDLRRLEMVDRDGDAAAAGVVDQRRGLLDSSPAGRTRAPPGRRTTGAVDVRPASPSATAVPRPRRASRRPRAATFPFGG